MKYEAPARVVNDEAVIALRGSSRAHLAKTAQLRSAETGETLAALCGREG